MSLDGTYTAVLDRIEAGAEQELAVLVLEADGEAIDELVVPVGLLPENGRQPDTVLEVVVEDGDLVAATVDETETEQRAEAAQDRFERLSRRIGDAFEPESESEAESESRSDSCE